MKVGPFIIDDAMVRHMNGEGTAKELVLDTTINETDDCGEYQANRTLHIPVPYDTAIGDQPTLRGNKVWIEIEGMV